VIDFPHPGAPRPLVEKGLDGMNRLQQLLSKRMGQGRAEKGDGSESFSTSISHATETTRCTAEPLQLGFPHRLFIPQHYEPRYDYPLVVWLHSDHSSEWELDVVMEATSLRNYIAVAPRGHRVSKKSGRLFRWGTQMADLALAEDLVFECVDTLIDNLPVHSERIFLAGIGAGATAAQWIGLKHPHRFAGVISMQGAFPNNRRALASWKSARQLPVLFMQGESTPGCGDAELCDAMHVAHSAGLAYRFVRLRESEATGLTHDDSNQAPSLNGEMFAIANRFLMGIVTQTEISLEPEVTPSEAPCLAPSSATFGWN
jgi:phospholipase/carboxylesterase